MTYTTEVINNFIALPHKLIAQNPELAAAMIRQLLASEDRLRMALKALVDLNDDYAPFGGEMFQDRVDRTWRCAREALK